MKAALNSLKLYYAKVRGLFNSPIPTGMTTFQEWADSIQATYTLPTSDVDSVRWALASMIMHLGPQDDRKPKYYFVRAIRAGSSKQIAGAWFQDIKTKQAAAQAAKLAEATATPAAVADVPTK